MPAVVDPALRIEGEVIAAHARSLMAAHATDIASSDQHAVKPWLSARLDFSPPVADLARDGFSLIGGRLDYLGERAVAALLYQRRQHVINVFVWPAEDMSASAARGASRRGFNFVEWKQRGMRYWMVSDLGAAELSSFAQLMQLRTEGKRPD